jgi:hypothetical protein
MSLQWMRLQLRVPDLAAAPFINSTVSFRSRRPSDKDKLALKKGMLLLIQKQRQMLPVSP